jgi:hypothetical protein
VADEQINGMAVDSVGFPSDGNPNAPLVAADFNQAGDIKTVSGDLSLVTGCAQAARDYTTNNQWNMLWRDADLLFQSPRPLSVYENTYVMEPNVQRFTVAKIVNAIIPQLYKGLFYDDPPMLMRPRPGTPQAIVDAKQALFSYILDECNFKQQTKWGMETMATFGTGIWKWGIDWKDITTWKRKASTVNIETGLDQSKEILSIATDEAPKVSSSTITMRLPFFEHRPLDKVLVDPHLDVSDIRRADWVVDVHYMDFYQLEEIRKAIEDSTDKKATEGWSIPVNLRDTWIKTTSAVTNLQSEQNVYATGAVHHSKDMPIQAGPDPLRKKLEVLEYWDKKRKIIVINGETVLYTGINEFDQLPFLSCNWWSRPKAFFGMGLGLVIGQNQRVDQGAINAILKILSFGVNPIYLQRREANTATQMIRTGLGKIMKVDGEADKAFHLLEQPKVPSDVWSALKESQDSSESASGADQQLVQGSTAGPRSGMGRTSGGAAIQASASATRLDGPLDNFIEQVFKPFLSILDMLVFRFMHDEWILHILGETLGKKLTQGFAMQEYWDSNIQFEILAGASMSARRTMAQSMVMLTQILENPQLLEMLAVDGKKIKVEPIISMWMEASEWKNGNDIVVDMTEEEKAERKANSKAAMQQQQMAIKQQDTQQKFQQKSELEDQSSNNRIKRDLVIAAAKASGLSETVEGEPSSGGLEGQLPSV